MCIAQLLVVCLVLPGNKIQEPGPPAAACYLVAQGSSKKPQKTAIIYAGMTCFTRCSQSSASEHFL